MHVAAGAVREHECTLPCVIAGTHQTEETAIRRDCDRALELLHGPDLSEPGRSDQVIALARFRLNAG